MKFENFEDNSKIEENISEIKKTDIERRIKEFEIAAISEAVKDEMPRQRKETDDLDEITEIELIIEEMALSHDAQEQKEVREKLIKYIERIDKYGSNYINPYEYLESSGTDGRTYDEEVDLFIEKRKEDKDYCPTFEYSGINDLDLKKLEKDKKNLADLKEELELEKNESLKIICIDAIDNIENKTGLLESIKDKNYDQAFEYAVKSYGDIDDELFNIAKQVYDKRITSEEVFGKHPFSGEIESGAIEEKGVSEEEQKKIDMREKLKEAEFDAEDYKNYFEILIKNAGFKKYGWEVIITSEKKIPSVMGSSKDYDHPVVLIPEKYNKEKIDGLQFIAHINHEWAHIITQTYNIENGFGGVSFGADYETYTEGLGKLAEKEIEDELIDLNIIDKEKEKPEIGADPYYILGMRKVKEGADFGQLFDYLMKLEMEELKAKKESDIEKKAMERVKIYCRRIFRGFDTKEGGNYFPKDKAYLEGEIGAEKMRKEGLIDYLYKSKVDPALVPYFTKLGIYTLDKGLRDIRKVFIKIFRDKNWLSDYILDKEYFNENTMKDRDWAYKRQFLVDKYENE